MIDTAKTDSAIERVAKDQLKRNELNAAIYGGKDTLLAYMSTVRKSGDAYLQHKMEGRKKQLDVIAEVYALWAALECSDNAKAFETMKAHVASAYKVKFKSDVQNTAIVLRYAFEEITDKQVSVIGRVMRYCLDKDVTYDGFAAYVRAREGLEGVRKLSYAEEQSKQEAQSNNSITTVSDAVQAKIDDRCIDKLKAELTVDELDSSKWLDTEKVRVMFAVRNGDTAELKDVLLDEATTAQMLRLYVKQAKAELSFELVELEKQKKDLEYNTMLARKGAKEALRTGDARSYRDLMQQIDELSARAGEAREAVENKKKELKEAA